MAKALPVEKKSRDRKMFMKHILVVEDENNLARFIELELAHEGYTVTLSDNGTDGLEKALEHDYDCILLDLMLPGTEWFGSGRKIRKVKDIPIIIITAKGETYDKVVGLDMAQMIISSNL